MRAILIFLAVVFVVAGTASAFVFGELSAQAGASQSDVFGDVDCDGFVNSVDALKILRHGAGLTVAQNQPCPEIGTTPTPAATPAPTSTGGPTPTPTPTPVQNGGRLIDLGAIYTAGGAVQFPLVDIGDCDRLSVFATSDGSSGLGFVGSPQFLGYTSPDGGTTLIRVQPASWGTILQTGTTGAFTLSMDGAVVALPNLRLALETINGNISASMWCQP